MNNLDSSYNSQSVKSMIEKSGKYGSQSFHFQNKKHDDKLVKKYAKKMITENGQDGHEKKKYYLPQLNKNVMANIRS